MTKEMQNQDDLIAAMKEGIRLREAQFMAERARDFKIAMRYFLWGLAICAGVIILSRAGIV